MHQLPLEFTSALLNQPKCSSFAVLVWEKFGLLDYFWINFSVIISSEKKIFSVSLKVCLIKAQVAFRNLELISPSILPSVIYLSEILNPVLSRLLTENNHRSRKFTFFCCKCLTLCILRGEVSSFCHRTSLLQPQGLDLSFIYHRVDFLIFF